MKMTNSDFSYHSADDDLSEEDQKECHGNKWGNIGHPWIVKWHRTRLQCRPFFQPNRKKDGRGFQPKYIEGWPLLPFLLPGPCLLPIAYWLLPIAYCLSELVIISSIRLTTYVSGNHHLNEVGNKQGHDHNGGAVGHPLLKQLRFIYLFHC